MERNDCPNRRALRYEAYQQLSTPEQAYQTVNKLLRADQRELKELLDTLSRLAGWTLLGELAEEYKDEAAQSKIARLRQVE